MTRFVEGRNSVESACRVCWEAAINDKLIPTGGVVLRDEICNGCCCCGAILFSACFCGSLEAEPQESNKPLALSDGKDLFPSVNTLWPEPPLILPDPFPPGPAVFTSPGPLVPPPDPEYVPVWMAEPPPSPPPPPTGSPPLCDHRA